MSGKRLTRRQRDEAWLQVAEEWSHMTEARKEELACKLLRHIDDVGVFAPAEPTDQEINEAIAKAQGWAQQDSPYGTAMWFRDDDVLPVTDYQPVSNLGQAIEAAAALEITEWAHGYVQDVLKKKCSTKWAARAISAHLYERIKND